ncbi:pirin family protein [Neptunicella marina]|uniref:Pirin family protein n=1 Tax=Neptunicella marina TaxID=2125989 RepID=A0A8J6IRD8_9ALTE|nr:pirin family protein [Neptunicella marina]MBC3764382.1 pirin family protein [Neptunicella marina]
MNTFSVIEQLKATPASDGAGVKLLRVFGGPGPERFDPFLMLDEFGSDKPSDYIAGFPPHPHRGFETVTYMLNGKMEHRDHLGNVGLLQEGGVQWMTAGKGVIHSEMPKQQEGLMRGFQLWVNLPAKNKMTPANYQDIDSQLIPLKETDFGWVKAIAGHSVISGHSVKGYFDVADTQVLYLDISINAGQQTTVDIAKGFNTLVYCFEGTVAIGEQKTPLPKQNLARVQGQGTLLLTNDSDVSLRCLVIAGKPIGEPIAQYGPFVMNNAAEIEQAIQDYQAGVLTD